MSTRFVFDGLAEEYAELRKLAADLTTEHAAIGRARAERAAAAIRAGYPRRTGDLANHVVVTEVRTGPFGVAHVVRNTSEHAAVFESGSQARHTAIGANRGSMPPGHVFVPVMERERRALVEDDKELLTRHGLTVSGEA